MNVKDAAKSLLTLLKAGHGNVELIARDTRSGCTSSVSIWDTISVIDIEEDGVEDCGTLCDEDDGYKYVGVYLDH